jgi:hypothetical protein
MKLDKEDEGEDNEERQEAREGRTTYKHTKMAPSSPPRKRKVGEDRERRRTPKKARGNQDIKKYITCKRWKEEEQAVNQGRKEEEQEEAELGHKLPGGSRLDTTLAVPVPSQEGEGESCARI